MPSNFNDNFMGPGMGPMGGGGGGGGPPPRDGFGGGPPRDGFRGGRGPRPVPPPDRPRPDNKRPFMDNKRPSGQGILLLYLKNKLYSRN